MHIKDVVYGDIIIDEPLFQEIIQTDVFQRLKKISQGGVPSKYSIRDTYPRFEHSVGVYHLLTHFKADTLERVAGLLHDISHLAFSHLAEWVLVEGGNQNESYNQTLTEKFIVESQIPDILKRHNIDYRKIIDIDSFPLLKRKAPDLNCDRMDYALRDYKIYYGRDLSHLIFTHVHKKGEFLVFNDIEAAQVFSMAFLRLEHDIYSSEDSVVRYELLSSYFKKLIQLGVLQKQDFFQDDEYVLQIAEKYAKNDPESVFKILKGRNKIENFSNKKIYKKVRYIDPLVVVGDEELRISELSKNFKELLEKAKK